MKNVITKHEIVIALNEVVITLIPVYCKTERYSPNLINKGVATIGISKNIHKFSFKYEFQGSPKRNVNDNHNEKIRITTSKLNVIICLYNLFSVSNLLFKRSFYIINYS